jgi:tight adherence protein B
LPNIYLALAYGRKRKLVEDDLLRAITIMNNSFKSGSNVTKAVETVIDELEGPIKDEFKKILIDINYGLSLDVVFNRFYQRVKIEDAQYLTSSLALLNKTGGNIVKVFSLIEKTFYDKKKLRNELKSLTASSVFVFRFLLFLPFVFILLILIFNPAYFNPLFKHTIGTLVIGLIILLYIIYALVVKKVLKVNI